MKTVSKFVFAVCVASAMVTAAFADSFINGGFETNSFTGWTKGGGTWEESPQNSGHLIFPTSGDPGKSAIIHDAGGTNGATLFDPNTLGHVAEVLQGDYAARINNSDNGYHYSTLTQTVANYSDTNMYFGFAAVLQEPSNAHPQVAAPHFSFSIYDVTQSKTLYDIAFNVYNAADSGITWHNGLSNGSGTWKYSDWNVIKVDTSILSGLNGHDFRVSVAAYSNYQ